MPGAKRTFARAREPFIVGKLVLETRIDDRGWTIQRWACGIRRDARSLLRILLLCATCGAVSIAFAQSPFGSDPSDLWWNPNESGWGMQIVQGGDAAFATLFVYDANGLPTFYTATLSLVAATTWAGTLYRTTGPYFGAASFDPALLNARKVGTLTFTRTSSDEATLQYVVDGIPVSKIVRRELLRYDNYTGTYMTTVYLVTSHCSNSADNRALTGSFTIAVDHADNVMTISGSFAKGSACTYSGSYTQAGRIGAAGSTYVCSDGDQGSMSFFEMTKRAGMLSGRLQGHSISDACDYTGAFTGLNPL